MADYERPCAAGCDHGFVVERAGTTFQPCPVCICAQCGERHGITDEWGPWLCGPCLAATEAGDGGAVASSRFGSPPAQGQNHEPGETMPEIDARDCPQCDDGTKGRYDGRVLLGGRGIYTCPTCGTRWQDADEKPTSKGTPIPGGGA